MSSGRRSITGVSQKTCHIRQLHFLLSGLTAKEYEHYWCEHSSFFLFSLSESVIVSCAFDELIFFTVENLFIYLIINKQKNEII